MNPTYTKYIPTPNMSTTTYIVYLNTVSTVNEPNRVCEIALHVSWTDLKITKGLIQLDINTLPTMDNHVI